MDNLKGQSDRGKPVIDPGVIERRRHVQNAEANHRIEGFPPADALTKKIYEDYIAGKIESRDLVNVYNQTMRLHQLQR